MPNDITVTKNTTVGSERWDVEYTADQAATVTKTLDTAGTMLDRDIKVSITTPAGSVVTPTTSITANPSISVDSSGLITSSVSASQSVTPAVSVGFVSVGTANPGTVSVSGSNTSQLSTQAGTTISPTESEQTAVAAGKYTTGAVKVGAISSTYVGSGITQRTSSDLSASGATVTAPAGFYANSASKAVASGSATTPATTITPNAISISVDSSGLITAANTQKTQSVTPTVSAGYVSSGTAGTITVSAASNTSQLTTQAAQTIHPSTTDQTIASGKYLTGTQTVKGVLLTNLTAGNIKDGVTVKVGDSTDDDCVTSVTGTYSGGGAVEVEKKDVNFIDYDGTILYSYTAVEWTASQTLPANPAHTGLTAQGWNYTVAQINTEITAQGKCDIGQMYITDDNKTRIYVHFEEGRSSPYLGIGVNGTVVVDWGDNSSTTTLTGSSLTTAKTAQHVYAPGDYVIKLTVSSGSFAFFGVANTSHILKVDTSTGAGYARVYTNAVRKIELGSSVRIGNYAFNYCSSLVSITIPSSVTSIGTYAFYNCSSLASVTIPNSVTTISTNAFQSCTTIASVTIPRSVTSIGNYAFSGNTLKTSVTIPSSVTSIGNYAFQYNYALARVTIPNSVTSIGTYAFYYCTSLVSVTISSSVTSIGTYAFDGCYGAADYHILQTTPPTLGSYAFASISINSGKIYVPYSADHSVLAAYKTATNWSSYASAMVEESA